MAKGQQRNTGNVDTQSFDKSLVEDIKDYHLQPNSWIQARNAINNSVSGDLGDLGNEPSNMYCSETPYTIIGAIHLEADRWILFSTNNTDSEIGNFIEGQCSYTKLVNDPCLNFSLEKLIIGVSKQGYDCKWRVYWDDNRNPTRVLNVDDIPWVQDCTDDDGCLICTDTTILDCDKIRLSPLTTNPCFSVKKGASGGSLFNGSYYVVAAYVINQQRIGDYSVPSNIQALFHHKNEQGSLDIEILNMDQDFDEFELVLVSIINQQTVARRVGIYSTRQTRITIDLIDNRWPAVPIELLTILTPIPEKSEAVYEISTYMLRVGPTDKFDFNYQPLANQIGTKWAAVQYPADYYRKGGNVTSYLRDEVYCFFIRFVYDTGDKSSDFHIPGRGEIPGDFNTLYTDDSAIEVNASIIPYRWIVQNTATITSIIPSLQTDGGVQIAEGLMGYWESSEKYDDDKPAIWNAGVVLHPEWDLCGKQIRHHRFPDNITGGSDITNHYSQGGEYIRVMGVKFDNIQPPIDNAGNIITSIVGYEILRGTREGNKTVVAKGIINNMFRYNIEGNITNRQGLYPNYPYNDLGADPFISLTDTSTNNGSVTSPNGYFPNPLYSKQHYTFHSPDTQFRNPFLSAKEIKVYGQVRGIVEGSFVYPDKHPKHKFITEGIFWMAVIGGLGLAFVARNGKRTTTTLGPTAINLGGSGLFAGPAMVGNWATPGVAGFTTGGLTGIAAVAGYFGTAGLEYAGAYTAGGILAASAAGSDLATVAYYNSLGIASNAVTTAPGTMGGGTSITQESSSYSDLPEPLKVFQGALTFSYYTVEGVDTILRVVRAVSPYRQHALQYQSHCLYDTFQNPIVNQNRREIKEAKYLDPQLQDFGINYRINNLFRGRCVALETINYIEDAVGDNSKFTLKDIANNTPLQAAGVKDTIYQDPLQMLKSQAASHYVALKQRIRNQYGQIENIIQVPTTGCVIDITNRTSPIIFGGDTYIGRFTEKNTMFFFYDWLFDQPDGAALNYHLLKMIPHPAFWMDTDTFDFTEFTTSLGTLITDLIAGLTPNIISPSDKHCFDRTTPKGIFTIKNAFMYLFNSGVRDFFVESEINVELRDWEDNDISRHYDWEGYTDLKRLFNSALIKSGNFFKYDYSLSISRLFNNFITWGYTHLRNYDPLIAEQCYTYRPNRVTYSLPQDKENTKDYWTIFLANNYKDFKSHVTAIKPINKSGALFLFKNESPSQVIGVDQLQTDAGTKITIGDGGLFSQPQQSLLNADRPYEYGSCQNRLSVINTPAGIFWMSQNQGKIFALTDGPKEITSQDMKWWFATYLPYALTVDFPDFELVDNPVIGIGCQAIYDNENSLVYFCKKDWKLRDDIPDRVTYISGDNFLVNGVLPIKLGDLRYFQKASWTISYDPKAQGWLSYHDWHPTLLLPGKNTFLSILNNTMWLHNYLCDSYCNFYSIDYPFEIEYNVNTIQDVNTLRSIQYQLEVYRYADNCFDRFHVLDFNFDEAVIFNTEQCSGLLRLNLEPKNNPHLMVNYPIINPTFIDILFSKVEQHYRFNQFWDITDDRGEFSTAERMIWITEPNGYIKNLNPVNLNYNKAEFQRKKFRHYTQTILLRRLVSGTRKMLVQLVNNKNLNSPR